MDNEPNTALSIAPKKEGSIQTLQELREWKELRYKLLVEQSKKPTPASKIKRKGDYDTVTAEYMRAEMHRLFPGMWSWTNGNFEIYNEKLPIWVVSSGTLVIFHPEMAREQAFYAQAAHRITYKKNTPYSPENIVDLSNDVKSANTDAWKKAVNFMCNIADDVYRNEMSETWVLTEEELAVAKFIEKNISSAVKVRWINIMNNLSNEDKTFRETVQAIYDKGFVDTADCKEEEIAVLTNYLEGVL